MAANAQSDAGVYAAKPVYSEVMEDWGPIADSLKLVHMDTVVSIASAGDNVFHAALEGARCVHGVDIEPIQVDLCQLKSTICGTLPWSATLSLFDTSGTSPDEVASHLRTLEATGRLGGPQLALASQAAKAGGILNHSHLSDFLATFRAGLFCHVPKEAIEALLAESEQETRSASWAQLFERPTVLQYLETALDEESLSSAFIPRSAYSTMPLRPFARFLQSALRHELVDLDPRANYHIARLLLGRYRSADYMPPYLMRDNHSSLQHALRSISWHVADIRDFLADCAAGSINAFNLSNVLDWSNDEHHEAVWRHVHRTAAPGARLFLRSFFQQRPVPPYIVDCWVLDTEHTASALEHDRVGYFVRYEVWKRKV